MRICFVFFQQARMYLKGTARTFRHFVPTKVSGLVWSLLLLLLFLLFLLADVYVFVQGAPADAAHLQDL